MVTIAIPKELTKKDDLAKKHANKKSMESFRDSLSRRMSDCFFSGDNR